MIQPAHWYAKLVALAIMNCFFASWKKASSRLLNQISANYRRIWQKQFGPRSFQACNYKQFVVRCQWNQPRRLIRSTSASVKKLTDLFDTLSTPNYPLLGRNFLQLASCGGPDAAVREKMEILATSSNRATVAKIYAQFLQGSNHLRWIGKLKSWQLPVLIN